MDLGKISRSQIRRLLKDIGYDLTLTREEPGAYDETTSEYADDTVTTEVVRGVYVRNTSIESAQSNVTRNTQTAIISAKDEHGAAIKITPRNEDILSGVGSKTTIVDVQTIQMRDTPIAYVCTVQT